MSLLAEGLKSAARRSPQGHICDVWCNENWRLHNHSHYQFLRIFNLVLIQVWCCQWSFQADLWLRSKADCLRAVHGLRTGTRIGMGERENLVGVCICNSKIFRDLSLLWQNMTRVPNLSHTHSSEGSLFHSMLKRKSNWILRNIYICIYIYWSHTKSNII